MSFRRRFYRDIVYVREIIQKKNMAMIILTNSQDNRHVILAAIYVCPLHNLNK